MDRERKLRQRAIAIGALVVGPIALAMAQPEGLWGYVALTWQLVGAAGTIRDGLFLRATWLRLWHGSSLTQEHPRDQRTLR